MVMPHAMRRTGVRNCPDKFQSGRDCPHSTTQSAARKWVATYAETLRLFDRRANEVAVFGPTSVVVAHVLEPKEVLEDKPGMAGALANAAVGDRLPFRIDALLLD